MAITAAIREVEKKVLALGGEQKENGLDRTTRYLCRVAGRRYYMW